MQTQVAFCPHRPRTGKGRAGRRCEDVQGRIKTAWMSMDGPVRWMVGSDYSVKNGPSPDRALRPGRIDCRRVSSGLALVHLPVTKDMAAAGCEASEWPQENAPSTDGASNRQYYRRRGCWIIAESSSLGIVVFPNGSRCLRAGWQVGSGTTLVVTTAILL